MPLEIERKFIVTHLPKNLDIISKIKIYQTYVAIGDEEIRVRKITDNSGIEKHVLTIKKGSGLIREENEFDIKNNTYDQIDRNSNSKPLIKTRLKIKIEEILCFLDIYDNYKDQKLKIIEIEFDSKEDADRYVKPKWFGKDVTGVNKYKNQLLWNDIQD